MYFVIEQAVPGPPRREENRCAQGIIFLVSMLLSNVNILDVFVNGDVGDDGYYTSYEEPRGHKFPSSGCSGFPARLRTQAAVALLQERRTTTVVASCVLTRGASTRYSFKIPALRSLPESLQGSFRVYRGQKSCVNGRVPNSFVVSSRQK